MQMIACTAESGRRNNGRVLDNLWQGGNYLIHACTGTFMVGINHLSGNQRHILGLQIKVRQQALVNILYFHRPFFIAGIGFSLMQQNTFYHTILLRQSCHLYKTLIRIIVILAQYSLHPVRSSLYILLALIFLE